MNKKIMRAAGFGDEVDAVEQGKCSFCKRKVNPKKGFRDEISLREFRISGICQSCQDKTFKTEGD
jgi:hypothetical protein